MGKKQWNLLFGLITAFAIVTAFMPDTFGQWQWWLGGVICLGVVNGMVGYHESNINELEDKIKELENKIK